jgi:drug/metabolite transporter (DMT)-like permease
MPGKKLEQARLDYQVRSVHWGFYWALWCAILWGAWYIPGTAIWYETPFVDIDVANPGAFLSAAVVITALGSIACLLFLFLWLAVLGKWGEYGRTIRRFKISKWYYFAAIFGGPIALFGSYLAIGYVGPVFAAIAALMYPIIGATLAKFWYHERISARATVGIAVILIGGVSIYLPGLQTESTTPGSSVWLGYMGGLMAAVGWGIEGAIAGRILDVSDPDVGITIRFTAEVFYWLCLILPAVVFFSEWDIIQLVSSALNSNAIIWILLAGVTHGYCYVAWYKSFPLIGVGRGQAIAALYGVFAVLFLAIFTLSLPEWYFLIGLSLAVLGSFIMFTEKLDMLEVIRGENPV